jgi:hypothetical protein
MSERRQINVRLGDGEFDRKVAAIRRHMVLDNPAHIPTLADVLRAAVDRMHDDFEKKGRGKRAS